MVEKEIKVILSESQYNVVNDMFKWDSEVKQINHYYDNSNRVDNGITIRVREIDEVFKLQIKLPLLKKGNVFIKREFEKDLTYVPRIIKKTELEGLVRKKKFDDVELIGDLITIRKLCHMHPNVEICLDTNLYLNTVDYELEIEFMNEYPNDIIQKLKCNGIPFGVCGAGKHSRFINKYLSMHGV